MRRRQVAVVARECRSFVRVRVAFPGGRPAGMSNWLGGGTGGEDCIDGIVRAIYRKSARLSCKCNPSILALD